MKKAPAFAEAPAVYFLAFRFFAFFALAFFAFFAMFMLL
jgi:hypothetical protein